MLPALFRRQLRLIITVDGIIHITIEAITTHITTEGITTDIAIAGTTIGTGPGLSARMGVQGIIAIGKPGRGDHPSEKALRSPKKGFFRLAFREECDPIAAEIRPHREEFRVAVNA